MFSTKYVKKAAELHIITTYISDGAYIHVFNDDLDEINYL